MELSRRHGLLQPSGALWATHRTAQFVHPAGLLLLQTARGRGTGGGGGAAGLVDLKKPAAAGASGMQ